MVNSLKKIHRTVYVASVAFFFSILYPAFYFFSRKSGRYGRLNKFRSIFSLVSSAGAGIFYRYEFRSEIDWSVPYVICPNHSSNLDIPAITMLPEGNFAFMGKEELISNPITGIFFRSVDIPVNRQSRISAYKAFMKAGECLRKGMSVIVFPEGMIPDEYPPVLHDFKSGAFRLAIEHQVPVLPVTIKGSWKIMWDDGKKYGSRPGICNICVHEPVQTLGMHISEAEELKNSVFSIINKELTGRAS